MGPMVSTDVFRVSLGGSFRGGGFALLLGGVQGLGFKV